MSLKTFDIGPIRPPSEAVSLLLRVTENCTWNKCRFCTLYKGHNFKTRTIEDIKKDIDAMAFYRDMILSYTENGKVDYNKATADYEKLETYQEKSCYNMVYTWIAFGKMKSMFLQDANTMVLKSDRLSHIISYAKEKIPEIQRITSYGRADTLSRITDEGYKELKNAGLSRIHSGFETGSDRVLKILNKGTNQSQQIEGGIKVKNSGIELSMYFMPGAGGKEFMEENALETAKVINKTNPDFVRLRTFVVKEGSLMDELKSKGEFTECTDIEKVEEIRLLIENIKNCDGYIASDQIINLLENVKGKLDTDIPKIIAYIDSFLNLPRIEQKRYQMARRMGFNGDFTQLSMLSDEDLNRVNMYCNSLDENGFEELLRKYLNLYI
ncbi:MAG TPA: radical SAM protein [Candidatus Fimicola cottocaccae]|nr:radical SAM protein [Candidatus Fimicola cottocaccae]